MAIRKTEAIYRKREVQGVRDCMQREHGGSWEVEKIGRNWRAYQILTAEQKKRMDIEREARMMLEPQFDWFNKEGFASVYRERDRTFTALQKFQEKFLSDPLRAFRWSMEEIQMAGNYTVMQSMIDAYEKGVDAEKICHHAEYQAKHCIERESLGQSTNPLTGLTERAERIAWVKYAKALRSFLDHRAAAIGALYVL